VAAYSKDFVILACTILIGLNGVSDGQTDGQTDTTTMAKTCKALHAISRKNLTIRFFSDFLQSSNDYSLIFTAVVNFVWLQKT